MLPERLQTIVSEFAGAPKMLRLELLLEYAKKLPELPEAMKDSDALERVHECQTPFFLATEVHDDTVSLFFDAPPEAPTTLGFASIVYHGLNGESPQVIAEIPTDFYMQLNLAEVISPLRLRGMEGLVRRLKRQVAR